MTRTLPIILVLLLAAGIFALDPVRRAGPMLAPEAVLADFEPLPESIGAWQRDTQSEPLPRAFPPHNAVEGRTASYIHAPTNSTAVVWIVLAQDRRDLLAFVPVHAMRAGGWSPTGGEEAEGLWRTRHARGGNLLVEYIELDTAFVVPGAWGPDRDELNQAAPRGPGWPGPGALVQVLLTAPREPQADDMRDQVRRLAELLAARLQDTPRGVAP